MSYINFQFEEEKLVQALAFFSLQGIDDLIKLKASKLLYFADKIHLNRYGRPITGDSYLCMNHGPVPSTSVNEMNEAITGDEFMGQPALLKVLDVDYGSRYPVFKIKDKGLFERETFSRSELEVLDEVARKYGKLTAGELIELTHQEPAWTAANVQRGQRGSAPMPFETLIDASNRDLLESILRDQREEIEWDRVLDGDC